MNILLISRCPPYPLHLGDRLILGNLMPRLKQRGHRLDLIAFYDRAEDVSQLDHYRADFGRVRLIAEPKRSTLRYLTRLFRMFPKQATQSWSPEMWQTIEHNSAAKSMISCTCLVVFRCMNIAIWWSSFHR